MHHIPLSPTKTSSPTLSSFVLDGIFLIRPAHQSVLFGIIGACLLELSEHLGTLSKDTTVLKGPQPESLSRIGWTRFLMRRLALSATDFISLHSLPARYCHSCLSLILCPLLPDPFPMTSLADQTLAWLPPSPVTADFHLLTTLDCYV